MLAQHDTTAPATVATASQPIQTTIAPMVVSETVKNGTHTYTGTFNSQNACDSFGSGIRYSANDNGHVAILLMTAPSTTACAQAAGTNGQPFSVSIKLATKDQLQFDGVLLNGTTIPSILTPTN